VERELGAGGMATVFLAHDLRHEREVAIEVLHPDLGATLGGERFLAEIKTTAKLRHPHILPLLDGGEADGLLFHAMPYLKGETLRGRLTRESQLPVADATHRRGRVPQAHFRLLAEAAQTRWHAVTPAPLPLIGGEDRMAMGSVFYATDRPVAMRGYALDAAAARRITREGIVLLCGAEDAACLEYQDRVASGRTVHRHVVELRRDFHGVPGTVQRYALLVVPPG
jgi:hypothetical protein